MSSPEEFREEIIAIVNTYMAAIEAKDASKFCDVVDTTDGKLYGSDGSCFIDFGNRYGTGLSIMGLVEEAFYGEPKTLRSDLEASQERLKDGDLDPAKTLKNIWLAYSDREIEVPPFGTGVTAQETHTVTVTKKIPVWDEWGQPPPGYQPSPDLVEMVAGAAEAVATGEATADQMAGFKAEIDEMWGAGTFAAMSDGSWKPTEPEIVACLKVKVTLEFGPGGGIIKQTEEVLEDLSGDAKALEADIARVKRLIFK